MKPSDVLIKFKVPPTHAMTLQMLASELEVDEPSAQRQAQADPKVERCDLGKHEAYRLKPDALKVRPGPAKYETKPRR